MREAVLYIGMSLDGYIADRNGGVGWMRGQDPADESPGSYPEFLRTVDTVVMGRTTLSSGGHRAVAGRMDIRGAAQLRAHPPAAAGPCRHHLHGRGSQCID